MTDKNMVGNDVLLKLESRALEAEQLIALIRKEIGELSAAISSVQDSNSSQLLKEENERLEKEVLKSKEELTNLQKKRGVVQVDLPNANVSSKAGAELKNKTEDNVLHVGNKTEGAQGNASSKADASTKNKTVDSVSPSLQNASSLNETDLDANIHIGRLDLRVGRIQEILDHPDAENLFIEHIDVGEEEHRVIISGLRKHIQKFELLLRPVVVLCNLKPAKLRGIKSYGMLVCAVNNKTVEPLWPPSNAIPGQRLSVVGFENNPDKQLSPGDKVFETVAKDLFVTNDKMLLYKGRFPVVVENLGSIITKKIYNCGVA